jgi:polyisoprenoid-binding protein YceI
MKKLLIILAFTIIAHSAYCQLYTTRTGYISFYSQMPLEDIKAENNQVYAVIDVAKKNIAFTLLLKGFLFPKELQQEHFNENYVESDKYPKSNFTGSYTGDVTIAKDGVYKIMVKGNLTIHGVTKPVATPATLEVKDGKLLGHCEFKVSPEDYNITIPSVVRDKIAKQVTITVKIDCNNSKQ